MVTKRKPRKTSYTKALAKVGSAKTKSDWMKAMYGLHKAGRNPKIPNGRLVPARIKHNGHTYTGKVKRVNGRVKIFVTPQVAMKINPRRMFQYLVILHNKNADKGVKLMVIASTAAQASREAKRQKKTMVDARNWKVFSVKRLS